MKDSKALSTNKTQLSSDKQLKPIDFGKAGICGSISPFGNLLTLNNYHSTEGFAGIVSTPSLSMSDRYNQAAVRQYRKSLLNAVGFGPNFSTEIIQVNAALIADAIPQIELILADGSKAITTVIACDYGVVQRWEFEGISPSWKGSLSIERAAYSQLTEGGPLEDIEPDLTCEVIDGHFQLNNRNIPCTAIIDGFSALCSLEKSHSEQVVEITASSADSHTVILTYAVSENTKTALSNAIKLSAYQDPESFNALLEQESQQWQEYFEDTANDLILRRGLVYARMLCIPSSDEATCIMTDHMLLPLSWNRDAYYVAIALLQWGEAHWQLVRQHLIWMFEVADRGDDNEWGRCYLTNGKVKDKAYQLDQQLFPLLELADYVFCSGDVELLDRLKKHIKPLVETILSHKDETAFLFPTDETPGDDPLDYQYHFSSHLLMWHTFKSLDKLLPSSGYDEIAQQVYDATQTYFIAPFNGHNIYAYATDAQGNHLFYQDANDVPLALAPQWGFVSTDDPVWKATIDFTFSPENENGYFAKDRLGSIHTPAPWPLGDIQKLIIARELQWPDFENQALADISKSAQWDGGLPEAYDGDTYEVKSRHWFAWPNALYAMAQLAPIQTTEKEQSL